MYVAFAYIKTFLNRYCNDLMTCILEWSDITVEKKREDFSLFEVSGRIYRGRLTCLVGPSGSGKSVLLQSLSGRIALAKKSRIALVDRDQSRNELVSTRARRSHIGFVSSGEELLPTVTPREALEFAIALRPAHDSASLLSEREQSRLVSYYLSLLDLEGACDTLFRDLSWLNQKRFSSIAAEMINERQVLLLDSPLTGLSQLGGYQFIKTLKKLLSNDNSVLSGILCSLLQPTSEVLSLFDDIILMAERGLVIYQGSVAEMQSYFLRFGHQCPQHYNASDFALFVLHSISSQERHEMAKFLRNDCEGTFFSGPKKNISHRVMFFTQLKYLTLREIREIIRNWKSALLARFVTSIAISFVIGAVYYRIGDKVNVYSTNSAIHAYRGCVLVMCCNAMFANAQTTVLSLPLQRSIFQREHALNMYSSIAYLFSKVPVELVLSSIQVLVQVVISYFLCSLQGDFGMYWITLVAVAFCAESVALSISALTNSAMSAIQTLPIVFLPQIIFSGLIISIQAMPDWIAWMQYICFLPYAMKLLCINEFGCADIELFTSNDIQCSNIAFNGGMLIFIASLFRLVALLALKVNPKSQR